MSTSELEIETHQAEDGEIIEEEPTEISSAQTAEDKFKTAMDEWDQLVGDIRFTIRTLQATTDRLNDILVSLNMNPVYPGSG